MSNSESGLTSTRVDKWLWAARFFKTRQLAVDAIAAGRVEINGERVKPAKTIKSGDRLVLRKPPLEYDLIVIAVVEKRGSATIARTLFTESAESIEARAKIVAELREMPEPLFRGRPTKRDRRAIEQWQRTAENFNDVDG